MRILAAVNTTTANAKRQSVRRWAPERINAELRQRDLIHLDIAADAQTSEVMVSHTIRRRRVNGPIVERVWAALQRRLVG